MNKTTKVFEPGTRIRVTDYENANDWCVGMLGTVHEFYYNCLIDGLYHPVYMVKLDNGEWIELFDSEMEVE